MVQLILEKNVGPAPSEPPRLFPDRLFIEQARVHPPTNTRRAPMALGPTKNSTTWEILFINSCLTSATLDIVQVNLTLFSFARALGSWHPIRGADGVGD